MEQNIFSIVASTDQEPYDTNMLKTIFGKKPTEHIALIRVSNMDDALKKASDYLKENKLENVQSITISNRGSLLVI